MTKPYYPAQAIPEGVDPLYTIAEAAKKLRVTDKRMRHLAAQAGLTQVRTHTGISYRFEEVQQLLSAMNEARHSR